MKRLKSHFYRFAVLGGDMRQVYLAELLEEKEYQVQRYGLTGGNEKESCSLEACLKMAQVVVAPIPFLREGVVFSKNTEKKILPQELLLHTRPGSILFAGGIPKEYEKQAKEKGIICVDYLKEWVYSSEEYHCHSRGESCRSHYPKLGKSYGEQLSGYWIWKVWKHTGILFEKVFLHGFCG